MMNYLNRLYERHEFPNSLEILLPAVKSFDGRNFDCCARQGRGMGQESELILYYGIPTGGIGRDIGTDTELEYERALYCPVCLVMDFKAIMEKKQIKEIFPFNPKECRKLMEEGDFHLENSEDGIKKYVALFYGSMKNYLFGEARKITGEEIPLTAEASRLDCLHHKLTSNEEENTISLVAEDGIPMIDFLKCIIFPEKLKAYESFQTIMTKEGLVCKTYKIYGHRLPSAYNQVVFELYLEYLRGEGYEIF